MSNDAAEVLKVSNLYFLERLGCELSRHEKLWVTYSAESVPITHIAGYVSVPILVAGIRMAGMEEQTVEQNHTTCRHWKTDLVDFFRRYAEHAPSSCSLARKPK